MRRLLILVFFPFSILMAQPNPAAFYTSEDPMEVLEAYCHVTGTKKEAGISRGTISFQGILNELEGHQDDEGLFSKTLFPNPDSWAHLEVERYVHPQMVPLIAKTLGWKKEEVWAVAQFEAGYVWDEISPITSQKEAIRGYSGPEILYRELGTTDPLARLSSFGLRNTDLVFTKIPVPPPAMRPPGKLPDGQATSGAANLCLQAIAHYARLYEFAQEKDERRYLDFMVQRYFAALTEAFKAPEDFSILDLVPLTVESEVHWEDGSDLADANFESEPGPEAIALLGGDKILVADAPMLSIFDWNTGTNERSFQFPDYHFVGLNQGGNTALFLTGLGLGQFDLKAGSWRSGFLPDMQYVLQDDAADAGNLIDHRAGRQLSLWQVPNYPVVEAYTADGKHVWLMDKESLGGIFSLETGIPLILKPLPWDEEAPLLPTELDEEEADFGRGHAIALRDGHWLVFIGNTLLHDQENVFQLRWEVTAACFDRTGTQLAVAGAGKMCMIDLAAFLESGKFEDLKIECRKLP